MSYYVMDLVHDGVMRVYKRWSGCCHVLLWSGLGLIWKLSQYMFGITSLLEFLGHFEYTFISGLGICNNASDPCEL